LNLGVLNEILKTHSKHKLDFEKLPEIEILRELLNSLEKKDDETIELCLTILTNKIVFFENEIEFVKTIAFKVEKSKSKVVALSREELANLKKFKMQLEFNCP